MLDKKASLMMSKWSDLIKNEAIGFDDITLIPQYSDISSRSQVDISSTFKGLKLDLPVFSANMDSVTGLDMALTMWKNGGMGVIHRYMTLEEMIKIAQRLKNADANAFFSLGLNDFLPTVAQLRELGFKHFCFDIAHAHSKQMGEAVEAVKRNFPDVYLMVGNVATLDAVKFLHNAGADAIKLSIAGGSVCTTKLATGHGLHTLTAIIESAEYAAGHNLPLIADGGLRTPSDIVKALSAGASGVMLGSMLAGTDEAPGELIQSGNQSWKVYRGMASREAQLDRPDRKSDKVHVEGTSKTIQYRGSVVNILTDIKHGIQSGCTYSGARTLAELRAKAVPRRTSHF